MIPKRLTIVKKGLPSSKSRIALKVAIAPVHIRTFLGSIAFALLYTVAKLYQRTKKSITAPNIRVAKLIYHPHPHKYPPTKARILASRALKKIG